MKTRLPRAPEAPLPELPEFLAPFAVHFVQRPSAKSLERYVTGLLAEQPTKNCDTLAAVLPGTSEQRLQYLLTDMAWDHADLNRQRVGVMRDLTTEGDAVLIVDDTGFTKQGRTSVGVQRQYSGTLGKTGNCHVAVSCQYAERTLAWPVDVRLYLPESWTTDPERCQRARVPNRALRHRTHRFLRRTTAATAADVAPRRTISTARSPYKGGTPHGPGVGTGAVRGRIMPACCIPRDSATSCAGDAGSVVLLQSRSSSCSRARGLAARKRGSACRTCRGKGGGGQGSARPPRR